MKQVQLTISVDELLMLRHAMKIAAEDGRLFMKEAETGKVDRADLDRASHICHKIEVSLERAYPKLNVVR